MILFSGNISTEKLKQQQQLGYKVSVPQMPQLPELEIKGPCYTMIRGDENNDAAMEFIEAIHDLYAAEKETLVAAYLEREKNREIRAKELAELRENPPPKSDLIINFWKRDIATEQQNTEQSKSAEGGSQ